MISGIVAGVAIDRLTAAFDVCQGCNLLVFQVALVGA